MGGVNHCSLFTLSFGEIPWFDDQRRTQPCDWLVKSHNLELLTGLTQKCEFPSQSQGCILR